MKAMVMEKLGAANLALRDVPDPKSGAGEVLVRMRAASLNSAICSCSTANTARCRSAKNLILLSDGAGEIAEVGAGVTEWKVGDRVVGCFFPHWQDGAPDETLCAARWEDNRTASRASTACSAEKKFSPFHRI